MSKNCIHALFERFAFLYILIFIYTGFLYFFNGFDEKQTMGSHFFHRQWIQSNKKGEKKELSEVCEHLKWIGRFCFFF